MLYLIVSGKADFAGVGGFASNGYGDLSPGKYGLLSCLVTEVVLTAMFHLISIPVTNTSVNPARSTGVALFAGSCTIQQLWLFWLAPIAGAVIGAVIHKSLLADD